MQHGTQRKVAIPRHRRPRYEERDFRKPRRSNGFDQPRGRRICPAHSVHRNTPRAATDIKTFSGGDRALDHLLGTAPVGRFQGGLHLARPGASALDRLGPHGRRLGKTGSLEPLDPQAHPAAPGRGRVARAVDRAPRPRRPLTGWPGEASGRPQPVVTPPPTAARHASGWASDLLEFWRFCRTESVAAGHY